MNCQDIGVTIQQSYTLYEETRWVYSEEVFENGETAADLRRLKALLNYQIPDTGNQAVRLEKGE